MLYFLCQKSNPAIDGHLGSALRAILVGVATNSNSYDSMPVRGRAVQCSSRDVERIGRKGQVRVLGLIHYYVLAIQKEIRADFEPITEHFQMSGSEGTLPLQQF